MPKKGFKSTVTDIDIQSLAYSINQKKAKRKDKMRRASSLNHDRDTGEPKQLIPSGSFTNLHRANTNGEIEKKKKLNKQTRARQSSLCLSIDQMNLYYPDIKNGKKINIAPKKQASMKPAPKHMTQIKPNVIFTPVPKKTKVIFSKIKNLK